MSAKAKRSLASGLVRLAIVVLLVAASSALVIWRIERRHRDAEQNVARTATSLAFARRSIQQVRELEGTETEARGALTRQLADLGPDPATNLPPMLQAYFKKFGFDSTVETMAEPADVPGLPGYILHYWRLHLTVGDRTVKIPDLLNSSAGLEQRSGLIHVLSFNLQNPPGESRQLQAALEISVLMRK